MNFKNIKYLFRSYWWVLLLIVIIFVSYGQTLNMYFWVDDWGMAYKMQHLDANIPNFGPGIFGDGAYRYNVTPFIALYPLFGLNAFPYFALGLLFYFLAALVVYLLAKELSGKKTVGIISATIFGSGYIGSDAMNHLNNSYQLVQTGGLSALVVWFLIRYYQTNSKKYYIFSLLIYMAILEFLFLRSHGVFLLVFSASILAIMLYKKPILSTIFKLIPFFSVWIYMFFLDSRTSKEYDGVGRGDFLPNTINLIATEKHFELFNNFLITLSSVVFPDEILFTIYRFLSLHTYGVTYLPIGLPIIIVLSLLILFYFKLRLSFKVVIISSLLLAAFFLYLVWSFNQKSAVWNPSLNQLFISSWFGSFLILLGSLYFVPSLRKRLYIPYFGLAWIISNVLTYFIYTPTTNLASNTRYLIPAFIGTCLLLGSTFSLFSKKYILFILIPLFVYCSLLISLTNERATYIVENISKPAKGDLQTIKDSVGSIDKNTIFYIEAANDSKFRTSELGGMPHLAIPVILGFEGIAKVALSYDELFYLLKENQAELNNIYTFFGKNETIINTTQEFRDLLSKVNKEIFISDWRINTGNITPLCCATKSIISTSDLGTIGVNPIFESNVDYPSLVPVELTLTMKINSLGENGILPFTDKTSHYLTTVDMETLSNEKASPVDLVSTNELERYLKSEYERRLFSKNVSITANSSEKTREVEFITDNKSFTSWEAKTLDWRSDKKPAELILDFGNETVFSNFIWINHTPLGTPIDYLLSVSNDGKDWEILKHAQLGVKEAGEITVDSFSAVKAKFLNMSINHTYGGKTSTPGISEIWVGETIPLTDLAKRDVLKSCLLCVVKVQNSIQNLEHLYKNIATAKISWLTDKGQNYNPENYKEFQLIMDGNFHTYNVYIPAQGSKLKKIKIDGFNYPIDISIDSASIRSLNLKELINKNLIHSFAK